MNSYAILADIVAFVHLLYVGFVVVGEVLIVGGGLCRWRWIRNPWFRLLHVAAIGYVAVEAILQVPCPMWEWENRLREMAGQPVQEGTFVGRLVEMFIVHPWPAWAFAALHIGFAVLVLATLVVVPPWFRRTAGKTGRRAPAGLARSPSHRPSPSPPSLYSASPTDDRAGTGHPAAKRVTSLTTAPNALSRYPCQNSCQPFGRVRGRR